MRAAGSTLSYPKLSQEAIPGASQTDRGFSAALTPPTEMATQLRRCCGMRFTRRMCTSAIKPIMAHQHLRVRLVRRCGHHRTIVESASQDELIHPSTYGPPPRVSRHASNHLFATWRARVVIFLESKVDEGAQPATETSGRARTCLIRNGTGSPFARVNLQAPDDVMASGLDSAPIILEA